MVKNEKLMDLHVNTILIAEWSRKPFVISASIHFILVIFFALMTTLQGDKVKVKKVEFTVIQQKEPQTLSRPMDDQPIVQPIAKKIEGPKARAVYGLNRNALTASSPTNDANTVTLKEGNTLSKEQDDEKLNEEDATSLPNPTDEFLVTSMPVLISDVRIPYPPKAREANVEGPVIMELLIDAEGKVRSVTLISGPGYGLDEAAVEAVKGVKFKPALLDQNAVAVKIRYTYRFVLETR